MSFIITIPLIILWFSLWLYSIFATRTFFYTTAYFVVFTASIFIIMFFIPTPQAATEMGIRDFVQSNYSLGDISDIRVKLHSTFKEPSVFAMGDDSRISKEDSAAVTILKNKYPFISTAREIIVESDHVRIEWGCLTLGRWGIWIGKTRPDLDELVRVEQAQAREDIWFYSSLE
jgi:hypothetical protein